MKKQELANTAVFAAIWAAMEITIGTALHVAKVPFRGMILAAIAVVILTAAGHFLKRRESFLLMGAVAATIKAVSAGGIFFNPLVAIFIESVIASLAFGYISSKRAASLVAGIFILFYTFVHGILMQFFFFGLGIFDIYNELLSEVGKIINLEGLNIIFLFAVIAVIHKLLGATAGFAGHRLALSTRKIMESEEKAAA